LALARGCQTASGLSIAKGFNDTAEIIDMIRTIRAAIAALLLFAPIQLDSQALTSATLVGKDSVTVVPSTAYKAGGLHRSILGDNYRDLWATPVKVPVLDLQEFAGGLKPLKTGGGRQTVNLRMEGKNGGLYVFRPIYKPLIDLPKYYKGTVIHYIGMDMRSASHPASALPVPVIATAAGLLAPGARFAVMPDDPALGKFQKTFAGLLGTIEEFPDVPDEGEGFRGVKKSITSQKLLDRINKDPDNQVDTREYLTARLVDMFLNDNDRHADQWRWARMTKDDNEPWIPIPRDRDKVFVTYEGFVAGVVKKGSPSVVRFDARYPNLAGLISQSFDLDRRLLAGVERSVYDSIANYLKQRITDAVIDSAMADMPREYAASNTAIAQKLRSRRDLLPQMASEYYNQLTGHVVDIHGTDKNDRLAVTRAADGSVEVIIRKKKAEEPYFSRRFLPAETHELRIYLHGGDDSATVSGDAPSSSIKVRIIGGNGTNAFAENSTVRGNREPTHFYDKGTVDNVHYEFEKEIGGDEEIDALFLPFNRRPLEPQYGHLLRPVRDHGKGGLPVVGLSDDPSLGLIPRVGYVRKTYAFRHYPYSSLLEAHVSYATSPGVWDVGMSGDRRIEASSFHLMFGAQMSQFAMTEFRGFGNDVPFVDDGFHDVRLSQWSARPALGYSFGPMSDISIGPVIKYTSTDSVPDRLISQLRPYGFRKFGQAGLEARVRWDTHPPDTTHAAGGQLLAQRAEPDYWGVVDVVATGYPAMWDVDSAYARLEGVGKAYLTLPVPLKPELALRAGGQKLFGSFPYFDAAMLGWVEALRTEVRQRYAGDASVYGSAELRVPIARFPFILPMTTGLIGFTDMGRVYMDGDSPGGWHRVSGGGVWLGVLRPGMGVTFYWTDDPEQRTLLTVGFAF
jgi:hypothetical protein